MACDNELCGRIVFGREFGTFVQQVCGTGVLCAWAGVVLGGDDGDGEISAEGLQFAGKFAELASDFFIELRCVEVETFSVGWV